LFARPGTGDVERFHVLTVQPFQHPKIGAWVCQANDQYWLFHTGAEPPSQKRAALEFAMEEDQRSIGFGSIATRALGVIGLFGFSELVMVRDDTILRESSSWTPASMLQSQRNGRIEGSPIDASLAPGHNATHAISSEWT